MHTSVNTGRGFKNSFSRFCYIHYNIHLINNLKNVILFENQIQTTSASPCRTQVQPAASFLVCSLIFIEYMHFSSKFAIILLKNDSFFRNHRFLEKSLFDMFCQFFLGFFIGFFFFLQPFFFSFFKFVFCDCFILYFEVFI